LYHQPRVLLAGWLDDAIEIDHRGEKGEEMSKTSSPHYLRTGG
jgi:hypothetical protein